MADSKRHNPVARHAHRYNRCQRFRDAKRWRRHEKHKARQSDLSGPSFLGAATAGGRGATPRA